MVKFLLELDALDVPVLLRVILDRAVGAKLAHLFIESLEFCSRTRRAYMDGERTLAVVRMLFLIHSVRSAYASSTISSARMSANSH